ncbi:3',5'-cyclic adenosine monophosphate phosphodiesterase CpdA [Micromonospora qiuiae]|uniref:3',5'-cyclic adenosine monophosphate phosphodiesterase CpdA n=1 Tax=Micromonospora qiuiae TaxID=502268 RepID=A0ABQ4J860_9ACTN|nr:metallophosphoesterase [Micromonospora qiuiae]GIJ26348.1 3',5'-cyclic adenosine monophosphate phosphodiesterase CpdA [Micromonospora qiuiae]
MTVLAHLSDLHLDGGATRAARAARAVRYLCALPGHLDAVLITGDLTENGAAAEYAQVSEVLKPLHERFPVLVCPGNHDVSAVFAELLAPPRAAAVHGGAHILLADSSLPGVAHGRLSPATLEWLDARLASAPQTPAFVGFHHPPAALGIPFIDAIGLRDPSGLAAVLSRHRQVVAVLVGHAHAAVSTTFAGLPLLVAPGVVSTAVLPWENTETWSYQDANVSLMFHTYTDGVLATHVRSVPV